MSKPTVKSESTNRDSACLHAFGIIAAHWDMTASEQCHLLGVDDEKVLQDWMERLRAGDNVSLTRDVLEGIGCVLTIYASLVILLNHDRSKGWVRAPNRAPLFGGRCAMSLMTSGKRKDLEDVARYLVSERYR
ncbi:MbcA/ParS/Xre antitoxin family protein [Qipengyuania gaetbuli]|uniref:antitoxin Xre/MbcA/ParS toxin-binding domain-containing protein n=1 Tax=Qipengyuania gaetbuli TaxID=266952 RepID=UPI001C98E63C|nr:antitoxin Xre/MbcA/ParS toxin-binding domain-containing protein [Qipengyuania gaetbuli]MBY6013719.1 MbcA/ParS/Xre antitoxin family protein [Qipengyuania gaetbuli]